MPKLEDRGSAIWFNKIEQAVALKAFKLALGENGELTAIERSLVERIRAKVVEYEKKGKHKR